MTEREFQAYKEKAIAQDVLSVENRIRHAFNQGVECGRKLQTQTQNKDYSIILGIDTDHLNELLDGKIINTADVLKGFKNIIDKQGLKGLEHWKTNFGGLINILYYVVQGSSVSQPQIASDCVGRKYIVHEVERPHGHWIGIDEEPHEDYECDSCGYVVSTFTANIKPSDEYKFCPNCGARMEVE